LEALDNFIDSKRELASQYINVLAGSDLAFVKEPLNCRSNYWLNAVVCESREHRDALLDFTNKQGVMTRPIWRLMNHLPAYAHCLRADLSNAEWLESRVVNLPSSVLPVTQP
jgi:dTDP-4-amino-4,6-dideoxygalactose transaminase